MKRQTTDIKEALHGKQPTFSFSFPIQFRYLTS